MGSNKSWTNKEQHMLMAVRKENPGAGWKQIQQEFFPHRTVAALARAHSDLSTKKKPFIGEAFEAENENKTATSTASIVPSKRKAADASTATNAKPMMPGPDSLVPYYTSDEDSESEPEIHSTAQTRQNSLPIPSPATISTDTLTMAVKKVTTPTGQTGQATNEHLQMPIHAGTEASFVHAAAAHSYVQRRCPCCNGPLASEAPYMGRPNNRNAQDVFLSMYEEALNERYVQDQTLANMLVLQNQVKQLGDKVDFLMTELEHFNEKVIQEIKKARGQK